VRDSDEVVAPEEAPVDPVEYQHLPLPDAGTIRVRYSQIEPLRPRRFLLNDDLP
jgi:hypothetical protein